MASCSTPDCDGERQTYQRTRAGKVQTVTLPTCADCRRKTMSRPRNPKGRTVRSDGYVTVRTDDRGWVLEHVLVMEEILGRRLLPGETVHRRPGVERADNRPEGLELWIDGRPAHLTTCPHCGGDLTAS